MTGVSIETVLELWASSLRDVKARMRPLFTQERVASRPHPAGLARLSDPSNPSRKSPSIKRGFPRLLCPRCGARHPARVPIARACARTRSILVFASSNGNRSAGRSIANAPLEDRESLLERQIAARMGDDVGLACPLDWFGIGASQSDHERQ
jgi:hypothetical protein